MKDAERIVRQVVGPLERHCSGAGPRECYVTTPLIGAGVAALDRPHAGSSLLEQTVAFDRAEGSFADITQTNLVAVSSFNGPQGLLLGYDLLPQPPEPHPLLGGGSCPAVFDAEPVFQATRALYGTVREKRFPIQPGQHVLAAYKTLFRAGPCRLYGALAVAIARDRERDADLFMEDLGLLGDAAPDRPDLLRETLALERLALERLVDAVSRIGDNLRVTYEKILVGFRALPVAAGEIGCVLTAAPYVRLARGAVPYGSPEALLRIPLAEWEEATREHFLTPPPCPPSSLFCTPCASSCC